MTEREEQQFSLQLLRLLQGGAPEEAIPLLDGRKVHEIWCDKAVGAYAACGEDGKAREVIRWAKENARDIASYRRCLLEYSGSLWRRYAKTSAGKAIAFGQAKGKDEKLFREIIDLLSPIVDHIRANERVSNRLEREVLANTVNAAIALGDADMVRTCGSLLGKYTPIPLDYVKLVLSHLVRVEDPCSIVKRLRDERAGEFQARLLALIVEAELANKPEQAFERGKELESLAASDDERRELCGMLFQIAQALGAEAMRYVQGTAGEMLGPHDLLVSIIAAAIRLRDGHIGEAKSILEKERHEDDPQWLQLYAYCLFSEEKFEDGLRYFSKAIERIPSIDMYKTLGETAAKGGFIDKAILAYETIVRANPDNEVARTKVAQLYLKANDYQGAEEHIEKLWEADRENVSYGMNYVACLANQGKVDDALQICKALCRLEKPPIEAVVTVAQLYKTRHQAAEGFKFLEQYRERFWDDPAFLMAYQDAGYACDQEAQAHEAFSRVLHLQRQGKAPPDLIQTKTLDDLLEHHKRWTERTELISNNVLRGRMPWLMADDALNNATVMGWAIRTQPLIWLGDDVVSRASYGIYSTNAFHAAEVDGRRRLEPLPMPARGDRVVIDLSALMTLCRLDLLEEATGYFGEVYVSSRYTSHLMAQTPRLEFHQLSHVKSARLMKQEVDSGQISVLIDAGTPGNRPYPYVHEHTDDDAEHYYRLRDVIAVLYDGGMIDGQKKQELIRIAAKPSGADGEHAPLQRGDKIMVELSTLRTLVNFSVYDAVKQSFSLAISPAAKGSLDSDLRGIAYQEECQKWHDDLLRQLNQFETLAPNYVTGDTSDVCLDSYFLAKSKGISVLADDRVIHVLALNDGEFKGDVFGVDSLLRAFERDGVLGVAKCDAAYLQLIKWRYRFLVPSVDCLVRLAKQYKENPPGNELRVIATYGHDCMRDLGLFSGLEKTDPPVPMCGRLYTAWADLVVRFVSHIWQDTEFTCDVASDLTKWSLSEFLPSLPGAFIPRRIGMVGVTEQLFCEKLLFDLVTVGDTSRAKTAISSISQALGMSDKELYRALTDTLDRAAEYYEEN